MPGTGSDTGTCTYSLFSGSSGPNEIGSGVKTPESSDRSAGTHDAPYASSGWVDPHASGSPGRGDAAALAVGITGTASASNPNAATNQRFRTRSTCPLIAPLRGSCGIGAPDSIGRSADFGVVTGSVVA